LSFRVIPSNVPEELLPGETPGTFAERLARDKVRDVAGLRPDSLVLAGDTVVVLDGEVLGKPEGPDEAADMLLSLAGRSHTVISGLALAVPRGGILSGTSETLVTFRVFGEREARRYVATGEPMDKAGSYGIQGLGSALVKRIEGDYHTVVGLPIPLFLDLLEEAGWVYEFGSLDPRE
jgi:septum formation protein